MTAAIDATGPNPWVAANVESDQSWRIALTSGEARALLDRSLALADRPVCAITAADAEIPELATMIGAVSQQLYAPHGFGFCVLRGTPVNGLTEDEAIRLYWILGLQLGLPVTQSKRADFIGHVRREIGASVHRGYKSVEELGFHSDFPPLAGLLCLRQAPQGGESALVSAAAVHNVMLSERPDLLALCYQPFTLGRIGEEAPEEAAFDSLPIFAAEGSQFGAFYNRTLIDYAEGLPGAPSLTAAQREALDYFDAVCGRTEVQYRQALASGDLLFLNNYRVLHARTKFVDNEDPALRRHLLRLWLQPENSSAAAPASVRFNYRFGNIGLTAEEQPRMPVPSN